MAAGRRQRVSRLNRWPANLQTEAQPLVAAHRAAWLTRSIRPQRSTAASRLAPGGPRYCFRDAHRPSPNNPRAVPRRAMLVGSGTRPAAPDGMLVAAVMTLQGKEMHPVATSNNVMGSD
jgi:hypothetical protein